MKRIIAVISVFLLLCGCSVKPENTEIPGEVYVEYTGNETVCCFTVSEDLALYAICISEGSVKPIIKIYNGDGNLNSELTITDYDADATPSSAAYYNNTLYLSATKSGLPVIYGISAENGKIISETAADSLSMIQNIVSADDESLTLCAICKTEENTADDTENKYRLVNIDAEGEITALSSQPIIGASSGKNGEIYSYYSDDNGNYLFGEYEKTTLDIKKEYEKTISGITDFSFTDNGVVFYSPSASDMSLSLCYSSFSDNGISEIYPYCSAVVPGSIRVKNGFIYLLNSYSGKLERLKTSAYIMGNKPIRIISSYSHLTSEFSAGYSIESIEKSDEELSLAVLSNDRNFDAFYLSSRQDVCKNLKENGIFYPLNDVPNVSEYIDKCFLYIKDAVTDEKGCIYMIPIDVSIPVFIANKELAEPAPDVDYLLSERAENNYSFNIYPFINENLNLYFRKNNSFDTDDFRSLAEGLKKYVRYPCGNADVYDFVSGKNNAFDFTYEDVRLLQTAYYLINSDILKAVDLRLSDDEAPSAFSTFICVNPSSDNLESTLAYISALCSYIMAQNDTFMIADREKYTHSVYADSLYDIYSNAIIDYTVPREIYADELDKYLNEDIPVDEFITEADRKLKVYLNE